SGHDAAKHSIATNRPGLAAASIYPQVPRLEIEANEPDFRANTGTPCQRHEGDDRDEFILALGGGLAYQRLHSGPSPGDMGRICAGRNPIPHNRSRRVLAPRLDSRSLPN